MTNLLIYIYVFNQSPCIQAISSCCCFSKHTLHFCVEVLLHRNSSLLCLLWPLASRRATIQNQVGPCLCPLCFKLSHPNYLSGLCFFPLWFSIMSSKIFSQSFHTYQSSHSLQLEMYLLWLISGIWVQNYKAHTV